MTRDITRNDPEEIDGTVAVTGTLVDVALGYKDLTIISLEGIVHFDIRRPEEIQDQPYLFYMVDTME